MATTANNVNLENLRRSYKAFGAGDMGTLSELLSDETVWHILGRNPLSADYKGKDAGFGFFGKLMERRGAPSSWRCTTPWPMATTRSAWSPRARKGMARNGRAGLST